MNPYSSNVFSDTFFPPAPAAESSGAASSSSMSMSTFTPLAPEEEDGAMWFIKSRPEKLTRSLERYRPR